MANKSVGLLTFSFGANMDGFDKAMTKAQKKLTKFGKNLQKTGKTLSMSLTLPIAALGTAALKFGSDLEETNSKFLTVFSSIEKKAKDTAKTLASSFGLSELAAKKLLGDTGDLLVGFGFTEDAALELSDKVNTLAIDLASFTNFEGGAEGASKALTKALVGETESAKALGIVIRQGTKEYKDRTKAIMKEQGVSELQAKALNNLEIALSQSDKAIGDFARTSDSFANQMRIVKGELVDVASELGMMLIPAAKSALTWFRGLVAQFKALSPETKKTILIFAGIAAALGPVLIIIGKMSVGFAVLSKAMVGLGALVMANPWIALAAAIGGVLIAIKSYNDSLDTTVSKKQVLADIDAQAEKNIAEELTDLKLLTTAIQDENVSQEQKIKNLKLLQDIYPDFYGEIDAASMSTNVLTQKTNELVKAMMATARIEAMRDSITDLTKKLIEFDLKKKQGPTLNWWERNVAGNRTAFGDWLREAEKTGNNAEIIRTAKALEILEKEYINLTNALDKPIEIKSFKIRKSGAGGSGKSDMSDGIDDTKNQLVDLTMSWEKLNREIAKTPEGVGKNLAMIQGPLEKFRGSLGILGDEMAIIFGTDIRIMEEGIFSAIQQMSGALSQGEESFEEYGRTVKGIIRDVIGGLISQGITAAVTTALSSIPPFPGSAFLIPVLAGAAAGLARTAFNSLIPKFAKGGLVTGATLGLIGEGAGTSVSNPEVIAPLDKLKGMMGAQEVIVTGQIKGSDIWIANKKTSFNRSRTS